MQACYPVTRRGKQIVWSGAPLSGRKALEGAIAGIAIGRATAAMSKGYPGMKKSDIPAFIWIEQEADSLYNHTAHEVTVEEANLWKQQQAANFNAKQEADKASEVAA